VEQETGLRAHAGDAVPLGGLPRATEPDRAFLDRRGMSHGFGAQDGDFRVAEPFRVERRFPPSEGPVEPINLLAHVPLAALPVHLLHQADVSDRLCPPPCRHSVWTICVRSTNLSRWTQQKKWSLVLSLWGGAATLPSAAASGGGPGSAVASTMTVSLTANPPRGPRSSGRTGSAARRMA
jgi:hypothetical protein